MSGLKNIVNVLPDFVGSVRFSQFTTGEPRKVVLFNSGGRFSDIELPGDATMADAVEAIDKAMDGWLDPAFLEAMTPAAYNWKTDTLSIHVFMGS